jgi:hypothetical protein
MIRFLRQFEIGRGDYASERHVWVDATSLDDILTQNGVNQIEPSKLNFEVRSWGSLQIPTSRAHLANV